MKHKTTNILKLTNTVRREIQKQNLFHSQQYLLIAFSGGQDSAFCVLLLYLLENRQNGTWNRKKQLHFSKQYQTEKPLCNPLTEKPLCTQAFVSVMINKTKRYNTFYLGFQRKRKKRNAVNPILHKANVNPYQDTTKIKQSNCDTTKVKQGNRYVLIWCNHFWQKDSFFTMEHASKFGLCKNYAIHLCVPIQKCFSEVQARNWRHNVMQRGALFIRKTKCHYTSMELYLHTVRLTKPFLFLPRGVNRYQLHPKQSVHKKSKHSLKPLGVQGHNKSDRAEAILFNLIKGTGMNGIATLQWKRTFFSPTNYNNTFYPIFSDFFKEIRIVSLSSLLLQLLHWKKIIERSKVEQKIQPLVLYSERIQNHTSNKIRTFYYQLKYQTKMKNKK